MSSSQTYKMLGLMSGTSLDGLDIVLTSLTISDNKWKYKLLYCETIAYTEEFQNKLRNAHQLLV